MAGANAQTTPGGKGRARQRNSEQSVEGNFRVSSKKERRFPFIHLGFTRCLGRGSSRAGCVLTDAVLRTGMLGNKPLNVPESHSHQKSVSPWH